jgi:hypothetical protein
VHPFDGGVYVSGPGIACVLLSSPSIESDRPKEGGELSLAALPFLSACAAHRFGLFLKPGRCPLHRLFDLFFDALWFPPPPPS